jgi:hypothetical protein
MAEYMRLPANARTYKVPREIPVEKPYWSGLRLFKHAVDRAQIGLKILLLFPVAGRWAWAWSELPG